MKKILLPPGSLAHIFLKDGTEIGADECRLDNITNWLKAHSELIKDKKILDLGSNVGHFPIEMCRMGATHVWAFEPRPQNVGLFQWILDQMPDECDQLEIMQQSIENYDFLGWKMDVLSTIGLVYHLQHPWTTLGRILEETQPEVWFVESQLYPVAHEAIEGGEDGNPTLAWRRGPVLKPTAHHIERGMLSCGYQPTRIDLGPTYRSDNGDPRGFWVGRKICPKA